LPPVAAPRQQVRCCVLRHGARRLAEFLRYSLHRIFNRFAMNTIGGLRTEE